MLAMIAGLGCNCAHLSPFDKCVTSHAEALAAARVQAAIACQGDKQCIISSVEEDVGLFAEQAAQCAANPDGG